MLLIAVALAEDPSQQGPSIRSVVVPPPVKRAQAHYPPGQTASAACATRVKVADGLPQVVEVRDCADPFADAVANAMLSWRWESLPAEPTFCVPAAIFRFRKNEQAPEARRDKSFAERTYVIRRSPNADATWALTERPLDCNVYATPRSSPASAHDI